MQCETGTPLTSFVRIYERARLDQACPTTAQGVKDSPLVFLILEGKYTNQSGQVVENTAASEPFSEEVTGGKLIVGGRAPKELSAFA